MTILVNVVSYGLGLGATVCVAVALTRIARRPHVPRTPPTGDAPGSPLP